MRSLAYEWWPPSLSVASHELHTVFSGSVTERDIKVQQQDEFHPESYSYINHTTWMVEAYSNVIDPRPAFSNSYISAHRALHRYRGPTFDSLCTRSSVLIDGSSSPAWRVRCCSKTVRTLISIGLCGLGVPWGRLVAPNSSPFVTILL